MSIDFQELLGKERFKSAVSAELYAAYQADEEKINQDLKNQGRQTLLLSWNGGRDFEDGGDSRVIKWHGFYFVLSNDTWDKVAFNSFEEALEALMDWSNPEPELESDVLSLDELKKIAFRIVDQNRLEPIWINGAKYEFRGEELLESNH
jgi:hypothetical protein